MSEEWEAEEAEKIHDKEVDATMDAYDKELMKSLDLITYGIMEEFQAVIHGKEDNSVKDDELLGNYHRDMMLRIRQCLKENNSEG